MILTLKTHVDSNSWRESLKLINACPTRVNWWLTRLSMLQKDSTITHKLDTPGIKNPSSRACNGVLSNRDIWIFLTESKIERITSPVLMLMLGISKRSMIRTRYCEVRHLRNLFLAISNRPSACTWHEWKEEWNCQWAILWSHRRASSGIYCGADESGVSFPAYRCSAV